MILEQIREIHQARPFKPFTVRVANGKEYHVNHPEFLAFSQSGRTVIVATPEDTFEFVDLRLIASIHLGNGKKTKSRRPKSE